MIRRLLFFGILPLPLLAGTNPKTALAVRTGRPPIIDGNLDEPEWKGAAPAADFVQWRPVEGAPPTERTEFRILYDNDALYVGCIMHDSNASTIVARLARRDDEVESDVISLRMDTFHDHQTNVEFTVNAAGVKTDILQYDDGKYEDASWDVVWDVETSVTPEGWVAEFKIPFRALRFSAQPEQEWGFQVVRHISRKKESDYWVLIPKRESGWTSRFGHLKGIRDIPAPANLEVLPYALGTARLVPPSPQYPDGREFAGNGGVDVKYRPTTGITVDAAFNPDFGQVEADPEVLNLSTFETFYPEKRPFFVEGSQIFQYQTFGGGSGLFYSRRIGKSIGVEAPEGGHVLTEPRFATILGAAKISGKTAGGLSVGALEAVTGREHARFQDSVGNRYDQIVEPLSNYSLVRLKQDVLNGSNIGVILTGVQRDGRVPSYTGGVDWILKTVDAAYRVDGFWAASHAQPNGEARDGSAGKIGFWKDGGEHWRGGLSLDYTSHRFYINDIGYFRRPNDFGSSAQIQYRQDRPGKWYQAWLVQLSHNTRRNFDGADLGNGVSLEGEVEFSNYWTVETKVEYDGGLYDDRESRGHGWYRKPASRSVTFEVRSDSRNSVVGEVKASFGDDTRGSTAVDIKTGLEFKPLTNLSFTLQAERAQRTRQWAWVANVTDTTTGPNEVSVFANRTASFWDFTSRGSWVFTRDLTLQWYLQMFVAQGTFEGYARIVSPAGFLPAAYTRPDFNQITLHSNVVLRWEYLPGSTLYLVWSQARSGNVGTFQTPLGTSLSDMFGLGTENVLMLKMSHWLSY